MTQAPSFSSFPLFNLNSQSSIQKLKKEPSKGISSSSSDEEIIRKRKRHHRHSDRKHHKHREEKESDHDNVHEGKRNKTHSHSKEKKIREKEIIKSQDVFNYSSPSYIIDTQGDQDNLRYGEPNKYKVPRYFRYGAGEVIGLDSILRIDPESAKTGKGLIISKRTRKIDSIRYIEVDTDIPLDQRIFIHKNTETKSINADDDFILLSEFKTHKEFECEDGPNYRSIHGMLKDVDEPRSSYHDNDPIEEDRKSQNTDLERQFHNNMFYGLY